MCSRLFIELHWPVNTQNIYLFYIFIINRNETLHELYFEYLKNL